MGFNSFLDSHFLHQRVAKFNSLNQFFAIKNYPLSAVGPLSIVKTLEAYIESLYWKETKSCGFNKV